MIKCIVIEDDLIWKTKLLIALDFLKISILGVANDIKTAEYLLKNNKPDLVITDILLEKNKIFELFDNNPSFCKIPTIFTTQSEADIDFKNASKVFKHLYLVKPIHKLTLKSAIENIIKENDSKEKMGIANIALKGRFNQKIQLPQNKIVYIQQDQHYSSIYTEQQQFIIKKSLVKLMDLLDNRFVQTHRSYVINIDFIENFGIGLEKVRVKDVEVPIGITFREAVKKLIAEKFSIK